MVASDAPSSSGGSEVTPWLPAGWRSYVLLLPNLAHACPHSLLRTSMLRHASLSAVDEHAFAARRP